VDRAGNASDFDAYGPFEILQDKQPPVCNVKPVVIKSKADGTLRGFSAKLSVKDNFDADTPATFVGWTSSDGGGSVQGVSIVGNDLTGQYQNAKTGLRRTYTLTFEATDDAGNVGHCSLKIEVN
jgi:hypothetical protein